MKTTQNEVTNPKVNKTQTRTPITKGIQMTTKITIMPRRTKKRHIAILPNNNVGHKHTSQEKMYSPRDITFTRRNENKGTIDELIEDESNGNKEKRLY